MFSIIEDRFVKFNVFFFGECTDAQNINVSTDTYKNTIICFTWPILIRLQIISHFSILKRIYLFCWVFFIYKPQLLWIFVLVKTFVNLCGTLCCVVFLWNSKKHPQFVFFFFVQFKRCIPPPTIFDCVNVALVISVKADYRPYYRPKTDRLLYQPPNPADNQPLSAVWTLVYHHWSLGSTAALVKTSACSRLHLSI